jgi:hypothetical protein
MSGADAACSLVEEVLSGFGLDPQGARVKTDSIPTWRFKRGSAHVVVSVTDAQDGTSVLRAVAPMMVPPEDADTRARLYEALLTLNAQGLQGVCFALFETGGAHEVVALAERPTAGLDRAEVEHLVRRLSAIADTYDDRLIDQFGGARASHT